jgi:hypothetical protein
MPSVIVVVHLGVPLGHPSVVLVMRSYMTALERMGVSDAA